MNVTTVEVRGQKYNVDVDAKGIFSVTLETGRVMASSLAELTETRAIKLASIRANIIFHRWKDGELRKGTLTGLHASNGNLLIKWAGHKGADQETNYGYGRNWWKENVNFLRLNAEEEKELTRLYAVETTARAEREVFEKAHAFNAPDELSQLIKDADAKG